MLIQNTSSLTQASPPFRPSGSGESGAVSAAPSTSADATTQVSPNASTLVPTKSGVAQQPSSAQLEKEVSKINTALQQSNKNLELSISVDKSTNRPIVKLTDKSTGETVVQYPSEAVLAISQGIDEFQHGLLLRQKA